MKSEKVVLLTVGVVSGTLSALLTWILAAEASPFYDFYLKNEDLLDSWRMLNFPVLLLLVATQINYRPFALLLIFLQWFIIGFLFSWAVRAIPRKLASPNS